MSQDIRRELISKNLGLKPINHGQIYTFQIALPEVRKKPLSLEQRQAIETSLLSHQSNLVSLIVRRTTAYKDDDIEYELVYGANWLQIAQELSVEKVWAWVFDLTDEQVEVAIAEMESLAGSSQPVPVSSSSAGESVAVSPIPDLDQKLQLAIESIKNAITPLLNGIRNDLEERLRNLNHQMDAISKQNTGSESLQTVLEKLDSLQQQLQSTRKSSKKVEPLQEQINLLEASDQEVENALKQVRTQNKQIQAAIAAVRFWRQSNQGLTWNNLESSVKARRTAAPHKIQGFAEGSLDRLKAVAYIPGSETPATGNDITEAEPGSTEAESDSTPSTGALLT